MMSESPSFAWLADESESFFVAHNAHLEAETTVARHLLHRERLGERLVFATEADRASCEADGDVWEISVRRRDGALVHFVGASLNVCLATARCRLKDTTTPSLAA